VVPQNSPIGLLEKANGSKSPLKMNARRRMAAAGHSRTFTQYDSRACIMAHPAQKAKQSRCCPGGNFDLVNGPPLRTRGEVLLAAAMDLARRGIGVFALHYPVQVEGRLRCSCGNPECRNNAAKHPYARLSPKGLLNASKDPVIIQRWWGPGIPYNIGARTGAESGIVVIDVDPRHGGDARLAELERRFGELPKTWRFLTGGGGEHILFRHPGFRIKSTVGVNSPLGNGLDVRADGGYIVAPPSQHITGRQYAINVDHEVELAEVPVWLASMIAAPAHQNRHHVAELPETWRKVVVEGVPEGRRNDAIARLAGHLLRRSIDPYVALDLCRVWNECRCRPPLAETEIHRTVSSIAAREFARREAHRG
jgi:hypothetical protein